eukprot:gene7588-7793_t
MTAHYDVNDRPVDCDTGAAIDKFVPAQISNTWIYRNGTKAGWGWLDYFSTYKRYFVPASRFVFVVSNFTPGAAGGRRSGKDAPGRMALKQGYLPGYQPFKDAKAISTPHLKVFLQNTGSQMFCENANIFTSQASYKSEVRMPAGRGDSWWRIVIPLSDFKCNKDGAYPHQLDRIDFQNTKAEPARFCLANLQILR